MEQSFTTRIKEFFSPMSYEKKTRSTEVCANLINITLANISKQLSTDNNTPDDVHRYGLLKECVELLQAYVNGTKQPDLKYLDRKYLNSPELIPHALSILLVVNPNITINEKLSG